MPAVGADAGLEVTTFLSGVTPRDLAATLAPYADQPLPISHELEDLWSAHGLRMISVPIEDAPVLLSKLQTGGGSQRQWLGQAYAWTEAAHGNEFVSGRIVALDAERIRLPAGMLRLLVRSWVEPVPPEPRVGMVSGESGTASDVPGAVLRVEMVPQHRESRPDTLRDNPLTIREPKIDAEGQGLLFSRLYARMSMPAGRAVLILAERPGANWRRMAQQPELTTPPPTPVAEKPVAALANADNPWPKRASSAASAAAVPVTDEWSKVRTKSETSSAPSETPALAPAKPSKPAPPPASGAPRLGEVIRGPVVTAETAKPSGASGDSASDVGPPESGPLPSRVATLGEAMLNQPPPLEEERNKGRSMATTQRTVILLIPRVPREFHLLGPTPTAAPARAPARREASSPRE